MPKHLILISLIIILPACSTARLGTNSSRGVPDEQLEVINSPYTLMDPELEKTSRALHYYLVGQLQYNDQEFPKALRSFEKASELVNEPAPLLHIRLAELLVRSGKLEEALKESEKALQQSRDNQQALLLHAGILEALQRGAEAEPLYKRLIESKPDMLDAYILLSTYYLKNQQPDKSAEILRKLIERNPNEPLAYSYLGRVFESKGDLKEAERNMRKACSLDKDSINLNLELLRVLIKAKKIEEAKNLCNQILNQDPNNIQARNVLGQLLIGQSKFDEALQQFQILEGVEQDATDTRFKIALIQIGRQNFKEAITELNLVLAAKPEYPEARYYLASVYAATGRKKEAIDELLKIGSDDSTYVQSRTLAAFILRQESDLEAAEKAVREAIKAKPDDPGLFSYLILILRDSKKLDEARELLEKAVEQDPKNEKLLFNYATVLHDAGLKDQSIEVMERIVVINPENADALNFIAYGLAENGKDLKRAEDLIQKALKIRPKDGYFLDTLGWIYYIKGDYGRAVEILQIASGVVSEDLVIAEHYADALARHGQKEKALEVYQTTLTKKYDPNDEDSRQTRERIQNKITDLSR